MARRVGWRLVGDWRCAAGATEAPHVGQNAALGGVFCWHRGHVMPKPPDGRDNVGSEPWAETNRPRLAWSRTPRRVVTRLGRPGREPRCEGAPSQAVHHAGYEGEG